MQDQFQDRDEVRENFFYFIEMQTRWNDNDQYGHVNNAVYLSYMEAVIMHFLMAGHNLDVEHGSFRVFTVENMCRYHQALTFPQIVDCGLRIGKIGNSSVRYEVGLFARDSESVAVNGYYVDVYVDPLTQRPISIPTEVRQILASIAC